MPVQLIITLAYVGIAILIGVTSARGRIMSRVEEWSISNRTLGFVVTYFLNAAGIISAFSMLGAPGLAYTSGVAICYVIIYVSLQEIVAFYVAPRVWALGSRLGHLTQAQAVAERYESKFLGAAFSVVTSLGLIAYAVTQALGCALVLNAMSGGRFPVWLGAVVVLGAMSVYIYVGGLRAIGWTNIFQGVLMFLVAWVAGMGVARAAYGSWWFGNLYRSILAKSPQHLTLPGALGNWGYAFWTTSILVSVFSVWPTGWVWYMGAKDLKVLRRSIALMPLFLLLMIPTLSLGFGAIELAPGLKLTDQAALTVATKFLPAGLAGLLGAGVLAAAMSSAEPCLHVIALTYANDVVSAVIHVPRQKLGQLARVLLVIVALGVVLPLTILRPATLVYITLIGYGFLGQAFPAVVGILAWPRATREGTTAGLLAGFLVTLVLNLKRVNPLGIHAGIWGLAVNAVLFFVVSLLTKPNKDAVERFFPGHRLETSNS